MIRRSFLRRMAYAAMAGMLGAELAWRAPKWDFDAALAKVKIDLLAEINELNGGGWYFVDPCLADHLPMVKATLT